MSTTHCTLFPPPFFYVFAHACPRGVQWREWHQAKLSCISVLIYGNKGKNINAEEGWG